VKRSAEIDRFLLDALCEQLSPFEYLLSEAQHALNKDDLEHLAGRLLVLVRRRLVNSYLLHVEPPFVTPVDTDTDGIYRHWFAISEEGLKHLGRLPPHHESEVAAGKALPERHSLRQRALRGRPNNLRS
jgi:hypothetical protein